MKKKGILGFFSLPVVDFLGSLVLTCSLCICQFIVTALCLKRPKMLSPCLKTLHLFVKWDQRSHSDTACYVKLWKKFHLCSVSGTKKLFEHVFLSFWWWGLTEHTLWAQRNGDVSKRLGDMNSFPGIIVVKIMLPHMKICGAPIAESTRPMLEHAQS